MKATTKIDLGLGYVATVYSDTFERLKLGRFQWKPLVLKGGKYVYAVVNLGTPCYLHRFIMGAQKWQKVDHKDRDTLNCRDDNLRIATAQQNSHNSRRKNSSGLKGVTWNRRCAAWVATITIKSWRYHLGVFKHKERAGVAVDRAALALHGEFACLNFPGRNTRPKMPTGGFAVNGDPISS